MKPLKLFPKRLFPYPVLLIFMVMACGHLHAQTDLYWAPGNNLGADGTWSTSDAVWSQNADGSGTLQAWPSSGSFNANFNGAHTITLDGTVQVNQIKNEGGSSTVNDGTNGVIEMTGDVTMWGAGNTIFFNVPISGTGGLFKIGNATTSFGALSPNLQGTITLNQGSFRIHADNVFPSISAFEFGSVNNANLSIAGGIEFTVPGINSSAPDPEDPNNQRVVSLSSNPGTLILDSNSVTPLSFYGRFGNNESNNSGVHVTKRGSYTQIFAGSVAQSTSTNFLNSTTLRVEDGTLVFAKTEGANAWASAGDIEIVGGELRFDGHDQLPADIDFMLSGGVMNLNNFRNTDGPGDGSGDLLQFGTLDLQGNAEIDFGSLSTSELWFADSSAVAWDTGVVVNLANFIVGDSLLRFGTNADALTSDQLGQFVFNGSIAGATIDSQGFIAPIPEPGTTGLLIMAAGMLVAGRRRRTRKLWL